MANGLGDGTKHSGEATLWRLRALIEGEEGPLANALVPASPAIDEAESFGALAGAGARTRNAPAEYSLLVESILEGYLLHYARGRIVAPSDPDLRLLGGDYLYALGLARLAQTGDLEAVGELADLISLCAQAHARSSGARRDSRARNDEKGPWRLTGGLWALATLAVGTGRWPEHDEAKRLAREGASDASVRAHEAARERAAGLGLGNGLDRALIAFDHAVEGASSAPRGGPSSRWRTRESKRPNPRSPRRATGG